MARVIGRFVTRAFRPPSEARNFVLTESREKLLALLGGLKARVTLPLPRYHLVREAQVKAFVLTPPLVGKPFTVEDL